jgi:hypothetical protein
MTERQQRIFADIQAEKAMPNPDPKLLKKLAHWLTEDDDIADDLKRREKYREGRGGSRSPSYGRWSRDDE